MNSYTFISQTGFTGYPATINSITISNGYIDTVNSILAVDVLLEYVENNPEEYQAATGYYDYPTYEPMTGPQFETSVSTPKDAISYFFENTEYNEIVNMDIFNEMVANIFGVEIIQPVPQPNDIYLYNPTGIYGGTGYINPGFPGAINMSTYNVETGTLADGMSIYGCVSIGSYCSQTGQGNNAVAIGYAAGNRNQDPMSIALGYMAGYSSQGLSSISLGNYAGVTSQNEFAISIGSYAGSERF